MAVHNHFDLIVIGTGAAGSAAWEKATRMGKRVAVFESRVLGGECPTSACVPTKALLQCADIYRIALGAHEFGINTGQVSFDYERIKARKDLVVSRTGAAHGEEPYLEAGVHLVHGEATFVSPSEIEADGVRYSADKFLIATGTIVRVPDIEGLKEVGFLTFEDAIDLTQLPESVFILGGGPVGCEFTQLFNGFGSNVIIADRNERLLSKEDREVGDFIGKLFGRRGVQVLPKTKVLSVKREDKKQITFERDGRRETVAVEDILIATGKVPNLSELGLEHAGVHYRERGIIVDDRLQTSNPRIYAAGDVAGPYLFTHAASYQGWLAVNNAFSEEKRRVDYRSMPRCVFTTPEVATVGVTERQARENGLRVRIGLASIDSLGRANTSEEFEGFVKVIADEDGTLIGGAIIAPRAGEMMHELALAIALEAKVAQLANLIHAFPTFSEAVQVACESVQPAS